MAKKFFTLEEANRTLPLVRRVVQDIVDDYRAWKECLARYELVAAHRRPEEGESPDAAALRTRVDEIAHQREIVNQLYINMFQALIYSQARSIGNTPDFFPYSHLPSYRSDFFYFRFITHIT